MAIRSVGHLGPTGPLAVAAPAGRRALPAVTTDPTGAVVDETIEIRLGLEPESGRLAIVGGDVRREPRQSTSRTPTYPPSLDDVGVAPNGRASSTHSGTIGRLVDRVA